MVEVMNHSQAVKEGKADVRRRNDNYKLTFGKFKNKKISKLVEEKEGLNYCIWLCKEREKQYNEWYYDAVDKGNGGFSKRQMRGDRLYSVLKFHLKRVRSYKSTLDYRIDQYGNKRRALRKKLLW